MQKFRAIWPHLDERGRRISAAAEAMAIGRGGISIVQRACGLSRPTIYNGIREIEEHRIFPPGRVRSTGAGRKAAEFHDPKIIEAMERLIDSGTRGDPESPLKWVTKSTRSIAAELTKKKHPISHTKVAQLLHKENYSLQGNRKTEEGTDHEDRDAQFRHINTSVKKALALGLPVISVDTKKKEILGNYKNGGLEWRPAKQPRPVQGHDFPGPHVPRAYPYGIYDIGKNTGFVNVGTDHDTSALLWLLFGQWINKVFFRSHHCDGGVDLTGLGGKLSTRFLRENGPGGSSSERRVLVDNFPMVVSYMIHFGLALESWTERETC